MAKPEVLKKLILQKLIRSNMWGGKHTPIDFVKKGVPEHYRTTHKGKKTIEKSIKDMTNDKWIIVSIKRSGASSDAHVSLNPRKVGEIKDFLSGG